MPDDVRLVPALPSRDDAFCEQFSRYAEELQELPAPEKDEVFRALAVAAHRYIHQARSQEDAA